MGFKKGADSSASYTRISMLRGVMTDKDKDNLSDN
jgi:hypothetical protein